MSRRMDLSGAGVRRACALGGLTPAGHGPHALHAAGTRWPEMHSRLDPWIELLAQLGLDPLALWPCSVALDFEGDQWTLLTPPHAELRALYGLDVQALDVWRPLAEHVIEQLAAGRLLGLEVDAFWLPGTAGSDYRRNHAKTPILLNEVDLDARRIGFFHRAGYFEARGEDVTRLLDLEADTCALEEIADWRGARVAQVGAAAVALAEGQLPQAAELIRTGRRHVRSTAQLQALALRHLVGHLAFRPADNPLHRFAARLEDDLPLLREYGPAYYRQWAVGGVQRLGAAFEFAARGLAWQQAPAGSPLHVAAVAFEAIARDARTLLQKGARAVASTKASRLAALVDPMARAWDDGMGALDAACRSADR